MPTATYERFVDDADLAFLREFVDHNTPMMFAFVANDGQLQRNGCRPMDYATGRGMTNAQWDRQNLERLATEIRKEARYTCLADVYHGLADLADKIEAHAKSLWRYDWE